MKIKFFILITIVFCISSCANLFTRNIGRGVTPGAQDMSDNNSTILNRYSEITNQSNTLNY